MVRYYTPELSEFYVGFEYDYNESSIAEPIWKPSVYHPLDFVLDSSYDSCEFDESEILFTRVKYLDREDIESLGFKRIVEYTDTRSRDSFAYAKEGIKIVLLMNHKIHIYFEDGTDIFRGTIKNKSELKRLITWLGILA